MRADAQALVDRIDAALNLVKMSLDWDRALRRLEAMLIVADETESLIITGNGDVVQPEDNILAIGSGGNYAMAAAKALYGTEGLSLEDIARKAIEQAMEDTEE